MYSGADAKINMINKRSSGEMYLPVSDLTAHQIRTNTKVSSRVSSKAMSEFINDRVEKLRELYEKHKPEIKRIWVLPMGETDGRKSIVMEEIIGEDISPFDLPDFEDYMPKLIDYINED